MRYFFTESSNLILTLNMIAYAALSLCLFTVKSGKGKSVIAGFQNVCNFFIAVIAFAHMAILSKDYRYIILFAALVLELVLLLLVTKLAYKKADRVLLNNMCLLYTCGMIIISRISVGKAIRQSVIFAIVLLICAFIPLIFCAVNIWEKLTWVYASVGLLMIGIVLILGNAIHGSKIAITVFGLTFQPSEAVKIIFVFFIASLLWRDLNLKKMIISAVISACYVLVLVMSRDLGSALIFAIVYVFMVYVATGNRLYLISGLILGIISSIVAYYLFSHVRIRVNIWLDPWADIDNKGYQIAQSLFSISGGGLFGTGLMKGSPQTIPFCEKDFIFSSVTEEMGIIFAVCMLLVCISSLIEMFRISALIHDMFYRLIVFGLAISLSIQTFRTVGGGIKFIPLTGVTLPLVSYGGTSLLVSMVMYYLVLSVYIRLRTEKGDRLYKFHVERKEIPIEKKEKKESKFVILFKPILSFERKKHVYISLSIFLVLFTGVIGYFLGFYFLNRTKLINNSYSKQEANLSKEVLRGNVLSEDGVVLAYSDISDNGEQIRHYPYGNAFCHVVGYSLLGKSGIEYDENYYLATSGDNVIDRAQYKQLQGMGRGNNVVSTVDFDLQKTADELLGDRSGAVILTDVKTGKILALVSHPGFDPNNIENIWDTLVEDKDNSALVNRVTQGLYPPGSTFKIFTAYEYFKEGLNVDDYSYDCQGYYVNEGVKITCFHGGCHGLIDFSTSFAKSCNSSFANIGMQLDTNTFSKRLDKLLFDTDLPDLFENASSAVSSFDMSTSYKQMQTSIGQGDTSVSPLHINMVTMAIANDGLIMKPYIVDEITDAKGLLLKKYHSSKYRRIMSADDAEFLTGLMKAVVEEGTASALKNDSYTAAGKTGSAEYNNNGDSHAWFTGFAPCEDPEIAVTVMVEKGGTGSSSAVPLAKALLDIYFAEGDR